MFRFCGARRFIYNLSVEQRKLAYSVAGRSPGYSRQCVDLKELRNNSELAPWLKEIPQQILQQTLKDVEAAFGRFFKGIACLPRFKSRYDSRQTFRVPQHVEARKINRKWAEVKLRA